MGHVLGPGRISTHQQTVGAANEKFSFPWSEETLRLQNKHKLGQFFDQPYLDPSCELRQTAKTRQAAQPKSSENDCKSWLGHKSCDDDELVKHMCNLPGFLQQVEKESSIQEKALNFGVLDWKRLEKWKYTERMPGKSPKKVSTQPPKVGPNLRKQSSVCGHNPGSLSGKQHMPHDSRFSSPQRPPPLSYSSHLHSTKEVRNASYIKEEKYIGPVKSTGKEKCNQGFERVQIIRNLGRRQDHFHQKVRFYGRNYSKANVDCREGVYLKKETMLRSDVALFEQGTHKFSLSPPNNTNAQEEKSMTGLGAECCPTEPRTNMFLEPKHLPMNSYLENSQFMESRTSLDGQLSESEGNRLSDFSSSQELYSGEISAYIAHSCPMPSAATVHSDCTAEPLNLVTSRAVDMDICTNAHPTANSDTSIASKGKYPMEPEETARSSSLVEASNKTHAGIVEQPIVRGRAPSPTRRFSFNLGKMSRNLSFKEGSPVRQLSSAYSTVKSGQAKPEISSGMDDIEREKENTSSRGRSSPLRRLLDPLLKYKGAQSAEIVQPPNGSLHSMTTRTTSTKGPAQDRKPEASTFRALLQLTLKNGLPLFKLVVDNSDDMLAAAVKRMPTSGKSDPCMIYAFYSVHEIRKKNMNWISQGSSNSKGCGLDYNIVGQMKISNFYHLKVNARDSGECDERECVLYGVNPGQVDRQTLEFVPKKEVAAIIMKNSIKKLNVGELSAKTQLYRETKSPHCASAVTCETEEDKKSSGTVVILPGGIHGTPIKGAPSSLISRWRSGGLCDCGGWDVGCKLRVLSDCKKSGGTLQAPVSSSDGDHVNLFVQGGEQKSGPAFSFEPLGNGLYSVELDASISLLEAFATCIAYVSCSKFPEIIDMKGHTDAGKFPEAVVGTDERKTPVMFQEQFPAKYVTCPPLSPAGRI